MRMRGTISQYLRKCLAQIRIECSAKINSKLAKLADNKQVFYMDIGDKFLTSDGTLTAEVMPDGLHPSEKGYQIWADAILPRVKELMK
jgi:lysophospholipase L1-like esterase